jgi:acyl-CoA reductase-like NAD-dependent aldehyde dehydrogenase
MPRDDSTVRKTYKLYIGGEFLRSESGRSDDVDGVNVPHATRKDLRDAVRAARSAFPGWSGKTAYNRGQILYRLAEMLDARRGEFAAMLGGGRPAYREVDRAAETLIWYAGWCDKLHQVAGTVNPVASPHFVFTLPEPTGVVGTLLPAAPPLLGAVRHLAPALCAGNTAVAVGDTANAPLLLSLAEVVATSDVPKGVLNLLTGDRAELLPWLASHMDVNAVDVADCDAGLAAAARERAAENVKRMIRGDGELTLQSVTDLMEMKTVWHPIGA